MPIRGPSSSAWLRTTTKVPDITQPFTACGWSIRYAVSTGFHYLFAVEDSLSYASGWTVFGWTEANRLDFGMSADTVTTSSFPSEPATNEWFFWFVQWDPSTSPQTFSAGWRTLTKDWSRCTFQEDPNYTPTVMTLLNDSWDEWVNGAVHNFITWKAVRTLTELTIQMYVMEPITWHALTRWTPLTHRTDLLDRSGNNAPWTAVGTLASAAGLPIPWRRRQLILPPVPPSTAQTIAVTDSGSGADSLAQVAIVLSLIDSAAGSDGFGSAASLSATDAGAGTDALASLAALLAAQDTGSGIDTLAAILAALNVTDITTATDAIAQLAARLTAADAGAGTDSLAGLAACLAAQDSGAGTDTLAALLAALSATDSGMATDSIAQLLASLALADSGADQTPPASAWPDD